jgi:hypothetical protein
MAKILPGRAALDLKPQKKRLSDGAYVGKQAGADSEQGLTPRRKGFSLGGFI